MSTLRGNRIHICALLSAIAILSILIPGETAATTTAARKLRVLYITESKGFKHDVLPESEKVMQELAAKYGFEVTVSQEAEKVITAENLKNFDAIMFYTTGELPLSADQKAAFLNFIREGKAFVGVHSATDTFYNWPEYGDLIGGHFNAHPWNQFEATIKVDDSKHPAASHLPAIFKITDEIYTFKQFKPDLVKVIMHLDTTGLDMTKKGLESVDAKGFPIAWWRSYGKGRVFYCALGHRAEVWHDDRFQKIVVNAIKWGARAN
jgi:type 1 glutamine amidotransferase